MPLAVSAITAKQLLLHLLLALVVIGIKVLLIDAQSTLPSPTGAHITSAEAAELNSIYTRFPSQGSSRASVNVDADGAESENEGIDEALHYPNGRCLRPGDRYVRDFIQYECIAEESGRPIANDRDAFESIGTLASKPVGCVPANRSNGEVIAPGATHTNLHFRYECAKDATDGNGKAIALKITHCVDSSGSLVKLGDFYTQPSADHGGEQVSIECSGDEFLARKIVHKWSKCTLPTTGKKLIEGNFVTEDVRVDDRKSALQRAEIISCTRDDGEVRLKCTGCVTESGVHVGITGYANVGGQWTQCRKYREGCRLINVTNDYVDCQYEGRIIKNGISFRSTSGAASYICNHGVVSKQGCLVEGTLLLVGDVRYVNDRPVLCEQSDKLTKFNGLIGCDLPDGKFRRFMEVWRDGRVMKRCSWLTSSHDNGIQQSQVQPFACLDGRESSPVPAGRVIQRQTTGEYLKCAPSAGPEGLAIRSLSLDELQEHLKKKTSRLNLIEYFGVGGRSRGPGDAKPPNDTDDGATSADCTDTLPFCRRLIGYCSFTKGGQAESGLALESFAEYRQVQERFELLASADRISVPPPGCTDQLTPFGKLQVLVQLSCPKTCKKCINDTQKERLLSNLEKTAHCG